MFACVYVYICAFTSVCVCGLVCLPVCVYMCVYLCVYVWICVFACVYVYVRLPLCVYELVCLPVCVCVQESVISELAALFPDEYLHIGGDEIDFK